MILGVDPGLTGGIALVTLDGNLQWAEDMPVVDKDVSATLLFQRLNGLYIKTAVVERVSSMPGQGVSSVFKFGKGLGQVLGVLCAMEIPIADPTPSQWKREMSLSKDKDLSREVAIKLWPKHAQLFKRKMDNGRAEAALIALWFLRKDSDSLRGIVEPVPYKPGGSPDAGHGRVIRKRSIA
jgi:crossover junction endodeoxyribonuclease RuvC